MTRIKKFMQILIALSFGYVIHANAVDDYSVVRSFEPHEMQLLSEGSTAFLKRLDMVKSAKESIEVEYFIYNTDIAGSILTQALLRKAQEGVKVRILLDHFMTGSQITPYHVHELREHGVEVKFYNTTPLINIYESQYRNHRKTFIVDGKEAIIGGRNVGEDYFDFSSEYNFLDRDVWIKGEVVKSIRDSFYALYNHKESKTLKRRKQPNKKDLIYKRGRKMKAYKKYLKDLMHFRKMVVKAKDFLAPGIAEMKWLSKLKKLRRNNVYESPVVTCNDLTFVSDKANRSSRTGRTERVVRDHIKKWLENTDRNLTIESPYFILNGDMEKSLNRTLDNGAEVDLITNTLYSTDALYISTVFDSGIGKWIDNGLGVHLYKGHSMEEYPYLDKKVKKARWGLHSKSMVIDKEDVVIGSYNFDNRSYTFSAELVINCKGSKEFAEQVLNSYDKQKKYSRAIDTSSDIDKYKFSEVSFGKKLGYALLYIPSHLLEFLL